MSRVIVHIDRLVLSGFRAEDRHAIAAGLQQQLGQVFAARDAVSLFKARGETARLKVGGVHIEHGLKPQRVGENVARGIGKEIKK